jgi:WD40 repeat protein
MNKLVTAFVFSHVLKIELFFVFFFLFQVACLSYVPKSDLLLSGSWDNTARIWSLSTRQCIGILRGIQI